MITFDRVCCVCSDDFITRNIYTVCCSPKCSRKGADTGLAKIAKSVLKQSYKLKKEQFKLKKKEKLLKFEESRWTEVKVVKHCQDYWKGEFKVSVERGTTNFKSIIVECKKHGVFKTKFSPNNMQNTPCKKCRVNHNRLDNKEFLSRCVEVHGDKFDYLSDFDGVDNNIVYRCPFHGIREMGARLHLRSPTGCALCSKEQANYNKNPFGGINPTTAERNPDEDIWLYVIKHDSGYKVGLSREVEKRCSTIRRYLTGATIIHKQRGKLKDMFNLEQYLLDKCERDFGVPYFGGHTECVSNNPLVYLEVYNDLV